MILLGDYSFNVMLPTCLQSSLNTNDDVIVVLAVNSSLELLLEGTLHCILELTLFNELRSDDLQEATEESS